MQEIQASIVRRVAASCLETWYAAASANAERQIRLLQVDDNLVKVSQLEGWQKLKGGRNGYAVLVTSLLQGESVPVVLRLNYEEGTLGHNTSLVVD